MQQFLSGCRAELTTVGGAGGKNVPSLNTAEETKSDVVKRVKKVIVNSLGVNPAKVTNSASFCVDLDADFSGDVELQMGFEKEFGVQIPDDQWQRMITVGDAIRFLERATRDKRNE